MTDTNTAVATTEQPRAPSPVAQVRRDLDAMAGQIKMALPSHVSVEKFQRVAMTAIQMDPELLDADRASLFSAITRAAQDGLLADKREGALVIFNSRKGKMVQWMPMVAGILKKVRQSGEIASISANVVHANDSFVWHQGDDEKIEHHPAPLGTRRGDPIGAYAIAVLKDGSRYREVMDMDDINKVRGVSRAGQYGPWKDWWSEMAKKTVIRRLAKRLPMSTDLESVINDEATSADFARGAAALMSAPQPLTGTMLAQQAGVTVEQPETTASVAEDRWQRMEQGVQERIDAEQVQDAEIEDVTVEEIAQALDEMRQGIGLPGFPQSLSEAAQQTLDDIDGPLDTDQAEDDGPDPRQVTADRIIADIAKCANVIDLQHLRSREKLNVEALPEEIAERVKVAYSAREAELTGKDK